MSKAKYYETTRPSCERTETDSEKADPEAACSW